MKLIKKILSKFSPLEMIVLLISITISTFLIIPVFSDKTETIHSFEQVMPEEKAYNIHGQKVDLFGTPSFYVVYENVGEEELTKVKNVLNEYLVPYHKLFDRHNDYYAKESDDEAELLHNLKYINDHKGEVIEIEKPLYDLLSFAKEKSILTPKNAFSMFIGDVYDFWGIQDQLPNYEIEDDPLFNEERRLELEELVSYIPLTENDIKNTLALTEDSGKYYTTFNDFNNSAGRLSISVGAIAKGMMVDILKDVFTNEGLTRGFIYAGSSSITFLQNGMYGETFAFKLPGIPLYSDTSLSFKRGDKYQMSTSGIYEGVKFTYEGKQIIRSHINDPVSGYPAQQAHQFVNIISNTLTGMELDYLSTALIVLSEIDGVNFLKSYYGTHDINVLYCGINNNGKYIARNTNYPGGKNPSISLNSEYREIFLDLL